MKRNILIFGASLGGQRLYRVLQSNEKVLGFIDNDPAKQGSLLFGHKIINTEEALKLDYDAVIIASQSFPQIGRQLIELGVPKNKIEVADIDILQGNFELSTYKNLIFGAGVFVSVALLLAIGVFVF